MYCTKCGKKISDDKNFCIYCGAPIKRRVQKNESLVADCPTNNTALEQKTGGSKKKKFVIIGSIAVAIALFVGIVLMMDNAKNSNYEAESDDADLSENEYDPSFEHSMTADEASEQGGLFVKSEDRFFPLQETNVVNQSWGSGWADGAWNSLYYSSSSDVYVPSISDNNQLVCFSSGYVPEYEILDVKKQGYTVDAVFWDNRVTMGIGNATVYAFGEMGDSDIEPTEVNGTDYKSFLKNNTVNAGEYCSSTPREIIGEDEPACDVIIADLDRDETISITYYDGTAKQEHALTADQEYWIIDGCERWADDSTEGLITTGKKLEVTLGDDTYGTIDVSDLSEGTYIIRENAVSDGFVVTIE